MIKVRVTDGIGRPSLVLDERTIPLDHLGENTYAAEILLPETETVRVKQLMITRRSIPVNIVKDTPPVITLKKEKPAILEKGQLQFDITVQDDYGVKDLVFRFYAAPEIEETPLGAPYRETRPVMSLPAQATDLEPVYDLAWHSWAGLPVIATFEVTDSSGHRTVSKEIPLTLPERAFRHPVAAGLIQERKNLGWTPESTGRESSDKILSLMTRPDLYQNDIVAFLAMRSTASRLYYNDDRESVVRVIETLWDTATY